MAWDCSAPSMPGEADGAARPDYRVAPSLALSIAASIALGRRRHFSSDARRLVQGFRPPPRIENVHYIPRCGPFILVTNHYFKPGYRVWWGVAAIAAAVADRRPGAREMVWMQSNRWTYPDRMRSRLLTPLTKLAFTRLANTYGFVPTPPMPRDERYTAEGAQSVRRMLSLLEAPDLGDRPAIGVAPEGRDNESGGSLIEPPAGTGRFLVHLARSGLTFVPAGVCEVEGTLTVRFGPPFSLETQFGLSKDERDRSASTQVMLAIGRLLTKDLWGAYAGHLATPERSDGGCWSSVPTPLP
jgi:hypothetical protein